jgi:hypothetical protein
MALGEKAVNRRRMMQGKRWKIYIPEILQPEEPQREILERIP